MECQIIERIGAMMTNAHVIDYFVITAADLTAVLIAWLFGRKWIKKTLKWQRTGNLYWLIHDLLWTRMQINRGNIKAVNPGISRAVRHATALGIDAPILVNLKALELSTSGKQSLTDPEKDAARKGLDEVIHEVGKLAESNQDDFEP
ncbi:MAG: hypothetical protein WAM13_08635 [Candidatus Sulfotelmatobacter sp.]